MSGYTDPATAALNDALPSASWNAYVRDNMRYLSGDATNGKPRCRVYRSTGQTGVSTGTAISFDSERFDPVGMHDPGSNPERITFPDDGKYLIGASVRFDVDASTTNSELSAAIVKNGSTIIAEAGITGESTASRKWRFTPVTFYDMDAGDYVEIHVEFSNMTNVNVAAVGNYTPEFWATWMGQ